MTSKNPFEYDGAINLPDDLIIDYYIEDFNYLRFIQSTRNVFLVGDRGSGKTMTLLYNRWRIQRKRVEVSQSRPRPAFLGIYVPCKTPLFHKTDHELLEGFSAAVVSEHFLTLSVAYAIGDTLEQLQDSFPLNGDRRIQAELEYVLSARLPKRTPFFAGIKQFAQRETLKTERAINARVSPAQTTLPYENTFSFASLIVPLLTCLRRVPDLSSTHFMLMIDDAHDLNAHQQASLNSWIAYRDHTLFSFKVATARFSERGLRTASGGSILEGHDFIRLDMVQPFQNELSDFGQLAERLVARRLSLAGINVPPDAFFPASKHLEAAIEAAGRRVRERAVQMFGASEARKISDYVYKHKRAEYFRSRPSKANRPEYSGFSTLVFLSTGVIRNLLQPCYKMYDRALSSSNTAQSRNPVTEIPPATQADVILDRSRRLWEWLEHELDKNIEGCSSADAQRCFQLMRSIAQHFRERLHQHKSEPTANSFTVSGQDSPAMKSLEHLIHILRDAQILYVRSGSAKDGGMQELYYIPNRMLWPAMGLDPHGQHARVSLQAAHLWAAASDETKIPMRGEPEMEGGLWDAK